METVAPRELRIYLFNSRGGGLRQSTPHLFGMSGSATHTAPGSVGSALLRSSLHRRGHETRATCPHSQPLQPWEGHAAETDH